MPSEKVLEQKKQIVADLAEKIKASCVGVIVDYKGISVADDTALRKELREADVHYAVVKNTLLKRAADEAGISGLDEALNGTTAIAISNDDTLPPQESSANTPTVTKTLTLRPAIWTAK